jgi:hypothetical protein
MNSINFSNLPPEIRLAIQEFLPPTVFWDLASRALAEVSCRRLRRGPLFEILCRACPKLAENWVVYCEFTRKYSPRLNLELDPGVHCPGIPYAIYRELKHEKNPAPKLIFHNATTQFWRFTTASSLIIVCPHFIKGTACPHPSLADSAFLIHNTYHYFDQTDRRSEYDNNDSVLILCSSDAKSRDRIHIKVFEWGDGLPLETRIEVSEVLEALISWPRCDTDCGKIVVRPGPRSCAIELPNNWCEKSWYRDRGRRW